MALSLAHVTKNDIMISQELLSNCEGSLCIYCKAFLYDFKVTHHLLDKSYVSYEERWQRREILTDVSETLGWSKGSEWSKTYAHWPNIKLFQIAAFADCHICSQLYLQLEGKEEDLAGDLVSFQVQTYNGLKFASTRLDLKFQRLPDAPQVLDDTYVPIDTISLRIHTSVAGTSSARTLLPDQSSHKSYERSSAEPALPTTLNNPLSWSIIKTWVYECRTQHENCRTYRENLHPDHQIPSRLIDVGTLEDFSDVRLCQTSTWPKETLWITLSHCWGARGLKYKLLKATEQSFMQRIDWEALPQSFKDAVTATRLIGIPFGARYLWIDALCIIQDSLGPGGDWERESKIMGAIYSWSFLTLAACTGPDSTCGLFPTRVKIGEHNCSFNLDFDNRRETGKTMDIQPTPIMDSVENSALKKRAWVVQELLLSRKILYLTPQDCAWACLSTRRSEKSPTKHLDFIMNSTDYFDDPGIWSTRSPAYARERFIHSAWGRIVGPYSACSLTFASDRLYAISGIAHQMALMLSNEERFLYGLWTGERFRWHLLWGIRNFPRRPRPHTNIPSWSWMSVANRICYPLFIDKVIEWDADVEILANENTSLAECERNRLQVRGPLYKVNSGDSMNWFKLNCGDRMVVYWTPECAYRLKAQDDGDFTEPTSVYISLVTRNTYEQLDRAWTVSGLVIQKVIGKKGLFTRIGALFTGSIETQSSSENTARLLPGLNGLDGKKQGIDAFGVEDEGGLLEKLEEDDYIEAHEDGKFTFYLE